MNEKVIVEVLSDSVQVIVQLFDLFVFTKDLDVLHLTVDESIETFDQLVFENIGKLVMGEVAQALINQPQVNVSDRVMNVEVFLQVKSINKLP